MKKTISLLLAALLLVSLMAVSFAAPHNDLHITYPAKRTERAYGPSNYIKKNNTIAHWEINYYGTNRQAQDTNISVYLYDKNLGDRGTHIEPISLGSGVHQFRYLGRSGKKGNNYKVVMKLNRTPDGGRYDFVWDP